MTDQENDPRIDDALGSARRTEAGPPPGFAASVMRRVSEAQAAFSWRERRARRATAANFSRISGVDSTAFRATPEGVGVMKKILLGTAAFGAVVIVAAWFMGFPPANDGTEATVGAATRYQGAQMTSKDVKLGSTDVQTFIQSDVFAKLVRNPDTRATLKRLGSDAAFRETFFSKTALDAMQNQDMQAAIKGSDVEVAFGQPAFLDTLRVPAFAAAAGKPAFLALLAQPAFVDMMRKSGEGQKDFYTFPGMQVAMKDPDIALVFADKASLDAMRKPAFAESLREPTMIAALNQTAFAEVLAKPTLVAMMTEPGFMNVMRDPAMLSAFRDATFLSALNNDTFLSALSQSNLVDVMRSPAFNSAFLDAARKIE